MKKVRLLILVIAVLVVAFVSDYCFTDVAQAESKINLVWADLSSPKHDKHTQFRYFIKRIHEETNNRVAIKMYPSEQLVKAIQEYDAIMRGTVDIVGLPVFYFAGKLPTLQWLFEMGFWELGDSAVIGSRMSKEIDAVFAKDGVKYLGWGVIMAPLCLAGPNLFKTFDDIKGMKVRAPGIVVRTMSKWGCAGVAVPHSEIYMGLQRGVVDATYNAVPTMISHRIWEVSKAITFNRSGGALFPTIMNKKKWDSLPDDIKAAFERVGREMVPWTYYHIREYTGQAEELLHSKFEQAHKLTPEENELWMGTQRGYLVNPMLEKYGDETKKVWEKVLSVVEESKKARRNGELPPFFE